MELSYQAIKNASQSREADELRTEARRKNLLILIMHYLMQEGYVDTASTLEQETKISMSRFEVCDNIDLETILMDYESYYFVKFQKYPKITKKTADNDTKLYSKPRSAGKLRRTSSNISQGLPKITTQNIVQRPISRTSHRTADRPPKGENSRQENGSGSAAEVEIALNVSAINREGSLQKRERLLKPVGGYIGANSEMKELAAVISRDIYLQNPNVRWDDIIGLDAAKRLVKEAVVYPIRYPQLFTGILSPWKGLLLYGPPGTGKTLLAKAVATECNTTFFNISASTIVSKWRGDSEKLVRVLFELARYHAPSTIFLDELESVMSQRGGGPGGEHEGSRRMKTELLVQMDGLSRSDDLVFVLAASNLPWELDYAMLRRLEKRILVDLPSKEAREVMISHWLPPVSNNGGVELRTELRYSTLGEETEGYSGSDIKLVCKEAAMRPVRKIFDALENHQPGKKGMPVIRLDTVTTSDFLEVLAHTKPSAKNLAGKYSAWQKEFESV